MSATRDGAVPYWRLSGFYLFYFASIGAFVPYWSLYLKSLGFGAAEIGELMAVVMATKVIAPNLWAWLADHLGHRMRIIRVATLAAALSFAGVLFTTHYWGLALVMSAFSFFWHAALPQFEATTMTHLGEGAHRYSHIRLWGSIGFILSVTALGPAFQRLGVAPLPWVMLALLAAIWATTLRVPEGAEDRHAHGQASLLTTLRQPAVIGLLLACFFLQASHGPYYTFFSIYLEDHGYTRGVVGGLWALGVVAEVGVFLLLHRWLPRYGAGALLLLSIAITAVRWGLIARFVDTPWILILAQTMHAASYGLFHGSAIQLVHRLFPGRLKGRGQALYSSFSFGLGGAFGSLGAGYAWEGLGGAASYALAGVVAALGVLCALLVLRDPRSRTAAFT